MLTLKSKLTLAVILAIAVFSGCKKDEHTNFEMLKVSNSSKQVALRYFESRLMDMQPKLEDIRAMQYSIETGKHTGVRTSNELRHLAEIEVRELVQISKDFLMEYGNLSSEELNKSFEGLEEEDFIFASLIIWGGFNAKNNMKATPGSEPTAQSSWSVDRAISCVSVTLGVDATQSIITNTTALTTVEGTKALLKVLGKRYLGYIGLAVAVYELGNCMEVW